MNTVYGYCQVQCMEQVLRAAGNDLTRLFLPLHARIAAHIARDGRPPSWDPAGFGGRPLVGNPQASLSYPPAWMAWQTRSPAATPVKRHAR